jgi:hypothetical protein
LGIDCRPALSPRTIVLQRRFGGEMPRGANG